MIRKLFAALLALLAVSLSSSTFAESNSTEVMLAKLFAVRQMVKTNVGYDEYKKQVGEIETDIARWESDVKNNSESEMTKLLRGDAVIRSAAKAYVAALNVWHGNDNSEAKMYWSSANDALADFETNYRSKK